MDYNYSTPVKDSQSENPNTSKVSKTHNQTREGDWICFNCNNLNFSFRKKCNRCKTQTRKQNEDLQNAYTLYYYNQQDGSMYSYENGTLYQPYEVNNEQEMIYVMEKEQNESGYHHEHTNSTTEGTLLFPRCHTNTQVIEVTLASPFKDITNTNGLIEEKVNNKKLRTPSSRKKRSQIKKNDFLPSVSPLLKKLLDKQDTSNKNNYERGSQNKDPLNVALFFDDIWNSSNKENMLISSSSSNCNNSDTLCLTNSGKKILRTSNIQKTSDSLYNNRKMHEDDGFSYLLRSPEHDQHQQQEEIIQIDQGDQELAQIINRIIV